MSKQPSSITYAEIYQQDASFAAIQRTLPETLRTLDNAFAKPYDQLIFTGCGTSFYLAQSAAFAFQAVCDTPAQAVPCSELYFFPKAYVKGKRTLVLPITRKSYTTEVRMAMDKVRALPEVTSLAITCDPDSQQYNDFMILSPDTAEDSVIMTRSFTSMVYLAVLLAFHVGGRADQIAAMDGYAVIATRQLKAADALAKAMVREHADADHCVILGQGVYYGIANECMNKIKEMSLSPSEAYHCLEYRHGPMSLADSHTFIVLLSHEDTVAYDRKLLEQLQGFGATTCAVGSNAGANFPHAHYTLNLPTAFDSLQNAPLIGLIGQFLGYHLAGRKGLDADTPRNLQQAIVL